MHALELLQLGASGRGVAMPHPMHALELLQLGASGRGVAMPRRGNCFKDQVGHARHGGNYNNNPVMPRRFSNDCGTLAEALRVPHGGPAKLHHDQTFSVHHDFSSLCNTAPSLSTSGTSSRVTPAPLLSAEVKSASVCTPSSAKIFCKSSAMPISSARVNAITDEPDPLMATPSSPARRNARHRSIPGTSFWR